MELKERLVDDMGNTINVNYTSQITNRYTSLFSKSVQSNKDQRTMADAISKAVSRKTENVAETEEVKTVSRENMSMDEYKQHIYDQIASFPVAANRYKDSFSVSISDAGFEAMKNDPEYENWVLDRLQREFAYPAPAWYVAMGAPAGYHTFSFGATKEELECHGFMAEFKGGQGQSIFDAHADKSFWSKRGETHKAMLEQSRKSATEKKLKDRAYAEKVMKERLQHQQLLQDFLSSRFFSNQQTANSGVSITAASYSSAIALYEANFLDTDALV